MSKKLVLLLSLILWSMMTVPVPKQANAQTPLTKAVIQSLRNLVRLMPSERTGRPARVSDAMNPGDALATGRDSFAELRFNDGSLARVGEQAAFQFQPSTRTFQLSNGTLLMLIPPGRGTTRVETPNARAGIRGSALFVRYNNATGTTIVGALTNSNIQVFNSDGSQTEGLRAGQLAVIIKDRIDRIYDFDIKTFYETSDLVRGLNLNQPGDKANTDTAMAAVQAETSSAAAAQAPISGSDVIENPAFVQLAASSSDFPSVGNRSDNRPEIPSRNLNFGVQNAPQPLNNNPGSGTPPLEGAEFLLNGENPSEPPPLPSDDGPPVAPGNPGTPGTPGNPGNAGGNGSPGTPGNPGNAGGNGSPGTPGNPGNAGGNGSPGTPGNPGNAGGNGPPGPVGNPGNAGGNGPPDSPGNSGNGPPGPVGNPGNAGGNGPPDSPGNSKNGPPGPVGNPNQDDRGK